MSKAYGQTIEKEVMEHRPRIYSPDKQRAYAFYIDRLEKARTQRDSRHSYFDDMNYHTDYVMNERAKNAYLRKKKNDSEVRVVTGTTEKKIEAVFNELLALNLQQEIQAYDKDDYEIAELGKDMSDIVTRTNRMEEDEDFWQEAVLELLTQRAVFIKENYVLKAVRNHTDFLTYAQKELVCGLKVYLGDITIPAYRFDDQPYIVIYNRRHWREMEQKWGDNVNWQYVRPGMATSEQYGDFRYRFSNIEQDEIEEIEYVSIPDNERMVMLNGVLMAEPGTKSSEIPWQHDGYNMKMFTLKSLSSNWAYGRPLTASSKTLQALSDETIRLMMRKFQQSLEPPLATPKGKFFSKDIWDPGAVTQGLSKSEFEKLIDHQGVTQSEFAMFDLIEKKIEEFVGASSLRQGLPSRESLTATEVLEQQRQAAKQLGLAVLGVARMKREMTKLRVYTVIEDMLVPKGKMMNPLTKEIQNVYTGFTLLDATLESGRRGIKRINFAERDLSQGEKQQLYDFESQQEEQGNIVRIKSVNVMTLKHLFINWFVTVSPQQREGSALDKVMFQDRLAQAVPVSQISGRPLNGDRIIDDYERTWRARDWFQRQAPPIQAGQVSPENTAEAQELLPELDTLARTPVDSQLRNGIQGGQTQRPGVNTLSRTAA